MTHDQINAAFEFFGGLFILNNCISLYRDKVVKGVTVTSTTFFCAWSVWNLVFYPALGQWYSFIGGLLIVVGNFSWVGMMIYYHYFPGGREVFTWPSINSIFSRLNVGRGFVWQEFGGSYSGDMETKRAEASNG